MKEKDDSFYEDAVYDNRDSVFLDIDRIINEGMAGGNVFTSGKHVNIEEARDLIEENKPDVNK